jgi:hypothetical protein
VPEYEEEEEGEGEEEEQFGADDVPAQQQPRQSVPVRMLISPDDIRLFPGAHVIPEQPVRGIFQDGTDTPIMFIDSRQHAWVSKEVVFRTKVRTPSPFHQIIQHSSLHTLTLLSRIKKKRLARSGSTRAAA